MSIFPYVYYMIRDFKVTQNDSEISVYAGMVTSAFAFAEFSSGVAWGRLSDKIGRKPVLLTGLAGTALSMLVFGFAPSLPVALLARALGGLLNGYVVPCLSIVRVVEVDSWCSSLLFPVCLVPASWGGFENCILTDLRLSGTLAFCKPQSRKWLR